MKTLPLTLYPDPLLRKKAQRVDVKQISSLQEFIDLMIETMKQENGIGLAAPQVGKSIRIIIIDHKDDPFVLINPLLSKQSFKKEQLEEGCLSIPGVTGMVKRHARLYFEGVNRNGSLITGNAAGLFARVLQHEVDHINGILFIDRASRITHGDVPKG